ARESDREVGASAFFHEEEEVENAGGAKPVARWTGRVACGVRSEPYKFMPDTRSISRAVLGALADAGVEPADIGLWFPSRNGVAEMDRAEEAMAREIFGALPPAIAIKQAIGEMAAAGGGQLVAACPALADPAGPFDGRPGLRRVLIDSFGAGGNFLAAVLEGT